MWIKFTCTIKQKCDACILHCIEYLLLYSSQTAGGSSGCPILKATDGELLIVGLHRGGQENQYNFGTNFRYIIDYIEMKRTFGKSKLWKLNRIHRY